MCIVVEKYDFSSGEGRRPIFSVAFLYVIGYNLLMAY